MNITSETPERNRADIPARRTAAAARALPALLLAVAFGAALPVQAATADPTTPPEQGPVTSMSGAIGDFGLE